MAVHDHEQFINDPPCEWGSTVTVRRRAVDTWQGQVVNVQAWCTEHPGEGRGAPDSGGDTADGGGGTDQTGQIRRMRTLQSTDVGVRPQPDEACRR